MEHSEGTDEIPAVVFLQDFFFAGNGNFRVDLGGGDAVVPHQFLDVPDVGAVVEQLGSEAVPEIMGRGMGIDAGHLPVFAEDFLNAVDPQAAAPVVEKDGVVPGVQFFPGAKPQVQFLADDGRGDEQHALFVPFSADEQGVFLPVVVAKIQGGELSDPETKTE